MRILMLTELYPPYIGGSEEHVRNLSRALVARGHEVSVATVAAREARGVSDEEGIRVHRLGSTTARAAALSPSGRPYLPPVPDPEITRALRTIVADERPDVVHAHNWMVHSFVPLKGRSGARLVMTLHDYSVVCAKRSLLWRDAECSGPETAKCLRCAARHYGTAKGSLITLGNWAMAPALRRAVDRFIPVSNAVAAGNRLAEQGMAYEVVPNFVPDDIVDAAGAGHTALSDLPAEPFWLYVGTLSAHKGVPVLLEAYAGMRDVPALVLLGRRAPDTPAALPDNVTMLLDVPHDAVMSAWQRSALGIVPSVFPDPCPTVALEAMAAGVPLVASRNGGLTDLVDDGKTGILVRPGDVAELRAALERMNRSATRRKSMARAALRRAPQFMASAVVPRIEAIYADD